MPRRAVVGWDQNRLAMIIAVLEARAGLRLGQHDVYLNVAGGLRIAEPAADLAAAAALVSSLTGQTLPPHCVFFGEIGLSGAIRPVAHAAMRLKEAAKLGFKQAILPPAQELGANDTMLLKTCAEVADLVAFIAAPKTQDHDDFGSNRSKIMNVIKSKS
jgi:DNA repair protein RadA/Sms